jgi:hypothetical protein
MRVRTDNSSPSGKLKILLLEGWLGIVLACIALVDATISIKAFMAARFFIYGAIALAKRHDRVLNLELYLAGSFFGLFVVSCWSHKATHFVLDVSYLLAVSLLFGFLSARRLRHISRRKEKGVKAYY